MSISFNLTRWPDGWRFGTDNQIDLTNWDLDYRSDRIRCTPTPMDFVYMAFGALLMFTIAICMLVAVINPRWLGFAKSKHPLPSTAVVPEFLPAMMQSKFQQDQTTMDEMRQATSSLLETVLKDKSPEEKAEFLNKIQNNRSQREKSARKKGPDVLGWLITIARILAIIPILFFSFFGSLCLVRVLRFFRDYLDLSASQGSLLMLRPKTFGGISRRVFPLVEISSIACYGVQHRYRHPHVQWYLAINGTNLLQNNLRFVVEHVTGYASVEVPTERVQNFSKALHRLTGAPIVIPRRT